MVHRSAAEFVKSDDSELLSPHARRKIKLYEVDDGEGSEGIEWNTASRELEALKKDNSP